MSKINNHVVRSGDWRDRSDLGLGQSGRSLRATPVCFDAKFEWRVLDNYNLDVCVGLLVLSLGKRSPKKR